MATKEEAAAQAVVEDDKPFEPEMPVEQTENQVLFGELTDEDKANRGFTDDELAEMEGDEEAEAEGEEKAEGEEGEEPAEGEEQPAEGEKQEEPAAGAEDAAAAPAAEETPAEGEAVADGTEDDPAFDTHPLLDTRSVLPTEWQIPQDAQPNLQALDQKAAELATSFDEGNMSAAEYRRQADAIDSQRNALRSDIREAQRAFRTAQAHWEQKSVAKFIRDNQQWTKSPVLINALDAEVRRLQAASADPFDPKILLKADRNLRKAMGMAPATGGTAPADPQPKPAPKPAKEPGKVPTGKKPEVPPTLARVPADEINDTEGGKWARLDRLSTADPLAYQDALNKMSSAEREAYLAA